MAPSVFERPCPEGWVYPCTLEDLRARLDEFSLGDVAGIWAVGLVPATRRDHDAYARYLCGDKPAVHVYSLPDDLRFRQPQGARRGRLEHYMKMELAFGMAVCREGARLVCQWTAESLRRFVLEYVLPHEIGHHVLHRERHGVGLPCHSTEQDMEQRADAYALRQVRARLGRLPGPIG